MKLDIFIILPHIYSFFSKCKNLIKKYLSFPGLANVPSHLELDSSNFTGKVNGVIEREWVALQLNELLVVEYYSRK